MKHYCPITGKEQFHSRSDAERVAATFILKHRGNPSVYLCNECHTYHLTHYTYQRSRKVRQKKQAQAQSNTHTPIMTIFTDTFYADNGVCIETKTTQDNHHNVRITLFDVDKNQQSTDLTYSQTLELIEALKIQAAKIQ